MEKKYRHSKTGEIISYKDGVIKSGSFVFELGCEPSKEYWEEITDKKDYEILSFIDGFEIFIKQPNGIFKHQWDTIDKGYEEGWNTEKHLLKIATGCKIHSVRRLSDGEIFTIGDIINFSNMGTAKLLEIEFECAPVDKGTGKLTFVNDHKILGKWWSIDQLSKERPVLFTTEDGVSIKEGDNYWFIWVKGKHLPNYQTLYHPYFVENAAKLDLDEYWSKDARFFSTEKAAKDFIIYHKPCLSIKEILSAGQRIIADEEKLKQLVKAKIDL